jgi:hypothetical protein
MQQALRPCADAPRGWIGVQATSAPGEPSEPRTLTILPLAMTAVFVWGVILPLELAVQLFGS